MEITSSAEATTTSVRVTPGDGPDDCGLRIADGGLRTPNAHPQSAIRNRRTSGESVCSLHRRHVTAPVAGTISSRYVLPWVRTLQACIAAVCRLPSGPNSNRRPPLHRTPAGMVQVVTAAAVVFVDDLVTVVGFGVHASPGQNPPGSWRRA